ncbi:MAG: arginine N-succinyltransferase, partial [Legionella sp. 40-6]
MMLFRSAVETDLAAIHQLAEKSGVGITTLTKDKKLLEQRLAWAINSFKTNITEPKSEYYFFVLEQPENGKLVGVSGIESRIGIETPFYSFKVSKRARFSSQLNSHTEYEYLTLVNDYHGASEICTLYLNPHYRKNNNGLLLSKGRFLYMAHNPQRFAGKVVAELRGVNNKKGKSPFWDSVGHHFIKISFSEADKLTMTTDKQFIADLMPRGPIYVPLLTAAAQMVIGKPHPSTAPAMKILLREGFRYSQYVDIFDGGPTLEAPLEQIRTIRTSSALVISSLSDQVSGTMCLIANARLNFRATLSTVLIDATKN